MNEQDDLYYLQPGFDLSSLTIPRLRSILVAHDIAYSSSAKKQDLVEIVQHELVPKARKLLSAQARVKRTSRGITDIPSSQSSTLDDEDDEGMRPPPLPKTPRSRRSKSNLGEETDSRSVRKSRTPSGRARVRADPDIETPATTKRTRKSISRTVEPEPRSVRVEEPRAISMRTPAHESSPFTDENPFQSGSSPPSGSRRVSSTSRNRMSTGNTRTSNGGDRRLTRSPQIKQEEPEYTKTRYVLPIGTTGIDRNGVGTSEEFTPEQEQELEQELTTNKQLVRTRNSALTRHQKKTTSGTSKLAPLGLLTLVIAAIGGWYRAEKINIGYWGVGESHWSLASNANIPAWVHENLEPSCEPCPQHATCFPNMEAVCEHDFILQPHPLNLNGLVPLPPTCEPDSEKERRIKAVADRAIEELRERRAVYECGDITTTEEPVSTESESTTTTVSTTSTIAKLEISEESFKAQVSKLRRKGMSDEMFEDLWQGAFADVVARDEVEVKRDGSGKVVLSSTSLARLPLTCAIRRSFIRTLSRLRGPIALLILILLGLGYGRHRIVTYNQAKTQTPSLVAMTLDRLATQAALKENNNTSEGFISVAQLRDDVLRNVLSTRERERVWERVKKIVEQNSNVRAATREGKKTGEWSRVWEWIGPTEVAAHSMIASSASSPETKVQDQAQGQQLRRWNEGRPIY